jgi:hypothetical protein
LTWDDVLDSLNAAGIQATEEIYIDNYGNTLPLDRPEFSGRFFRCARGMIQCEGTRVEVFLFPSETHLKDFLEVIGDNPGLVVHENIVLHFPESEPAATGKILEAISGIKR